MTILESGSGAPMAASRNDLPLLVFLAANTAIWLVYFLISLDGSALHQDMTEAYVWGSQFQLGYYKHPPLWAWIAGVWFLVLPHRDWAFYLLSMLNANLGLLGAWRLIGCFAGGERRVGATLLLLLTPFYTFLAFKYNANSIFLSLWPWTAYFFLRSVEEQRSRFAIVFGAMAACCILSKYFAVVLLASCLIAALLHPERRRYFGSRRPWLSVLVCLVLVAPHLWWLVATGFLPFRYFGSELTLTAAQAIGRTLAFLGGAVAFQAGVFVALLLMKPAHPRQWPLRLAECWRDQRFRVLAALAVLPLLLTILAGLLTHLQLSTNMTIGIFCLTPLLLMEILGVRDPGRIRWVSWLLVLGVTAVALAVSHLAALEAFRQGQPPFTEPWREMASQASEAWRQAANRPLRIVSGDTTYAGAIAFYGEDNPRELIGFDFGNSPWLTPDDIRREGMLVVCGREESWCLAAAEKFADGSIKRVALTLTHRFGERQAAPRDFVLLIVQPASP
jgi:4-amino-4-deoxy-L-arabinose transferase-like glycosyltransferase